MYVSMNNLVMWKGINEINLSKLSYQRDVLDTFPFQNCDKYVIIFLLKQYKKYILFIYFCEGIEKNFSEWDLSSPKKFTPVLINSTNFLKFLLVFNREYFTGASETRTGDQNRNSEERGECEPNMTS